MAVETIEPGRIIKVELPSPNGAPPVSPVGSSEVVEIDPAEEFKQRITAALFEDKQKLETLYPGVGFDLGELRRRIGQENDQKKGYKRELKAELAGWVVINDQRVLVTASGRKRKTASSVYRAAKRVAGQILVHSGKDLSGIEEFTGHFQDDAEKSRQLQDLKGQIADFNSYRKQLGRRHRQASYYLRDATELIIWRDYLDNHQRIHQDYDLAKRIPLASGLVAKVETVIPAEVRSGKQPRNKLRRELWQHAQTLEQFRNQQKTSLNGYTKITAEGSPRTIQEVVESSNKRLARIAALIGVPAAFGGLALLINQFLKNPHQVIEQKSADPDQGLKSPETDFPAEGTLVFDPPKPITNFLERFGKDNVITSEAVYDPDQAMPTFPPAITPTADNPPVEVFNTSRLEAKVKAVIEDTQRAVAVETPILHPAAIAAIQQAIDEKNKVAATPTATRVPTQISTSTPIPVLTRISTPARPAFSVASVELKTPITAATATKVSVVEKTVQPATPTARPAENKPISSMDQPRGRYGISQREIEGRRLIAYENAPKSCMAILAEVEEEIARLGDIIQVYDADRGIMNIQSPRQVLGIGMAVIAAEDATCTGQSESPLQSVSWWQLHRLSHKTWIERDFRLPFDVVAKNIRYATRAALKLLPVRSEYGGWAAWDVCAKGAKKFLLNTIGRIVNCEP